MASLTHEQHGVRSFTPEEREDVLSQMERLLNSSHFRNSRRYPALLRYIVVETLEGRGPLLKERTLGVEVFDRPPDYDTASDPIVRVTVAEIRKRIAQYYHDEAHGSELRIELIPGSYLPEFIPGRLATAAHTPPLEDETATGASVVPVVLTRAEVLESTPAPAQTVSRWRLYPGGACDGSHSRLCSLQACPVRSRGPGFGRRP